MAITSKKQINYYSILESMADCTNRAAIKLDEMLNDYTAIDAKVDQIHEIEHECDKHLHGMRIALSSAFITPLDPEDLMVIGNSIDSMIDAIEDVAGSFDMFSILRVEENAKEVSGLIVSSAAAVVNAMHEFSDFKRSKKLSDYIIEINHLEEQGDAFYRRTIKSLYKNKDMTPIEVTKWKQIYDLMELVLNCSEDVADMVEGLAIKNR